VACAGHQRLIRKRTTTLNHLLPQLRIGATVPKTPIMVIRKVVGARETNTTDAQGIRTNRDITDPHARLQGRVWRMSSRLKLYERLVETLMKPHE
jgi:hypothetical protein